MVVSARAQSHRQAPGLSLLALAPPATRATHCRMTDNSSDGQGQSQRQLQEQLLTINVNSSGNPDLESRIFNRVHGAGRQLGALSAVVELLLRSLPVPQGNEEAAAIETFRSIQADIAREKELCAPATIVEELRRAGADPQRARQLRADLRAWLDRQDAAAR